jgi:hypothetical protein
MGTKAEELANPHSCINKAKQNEPIFVLCGSDSLAPEVIRYWASLLANQSRTEASNAKLNRALGDAGEFERYAAEHGSHVPGMPYG